MEYKIVEDLNLPTYVRGTSSRKKAAFKRPLKRSDTTYYIIKSRKIGRVERNSEQQLIV